MSGEGLEEVAKITKPKKIEKLLSWLPWKI